MDKWKDFSDQEILVIADAVCHTLANEPTVAARNLGQDVTNETLNRGIRMLVTCPFCKGQTEPHFHPAACNVCYGETEMTLDRCLQYHQSVHIEKNGVHSKTRPNESGAETRVLLT